MRVAIMKPMAANLRPHARLCNCRGRRRERALHLGGLIMSNEPDPSGALPDDLRMLYENAIGNIEFAKRQQWWVTAQTLLLYAGLFVLFVTSKRHPYWEFFTFEVVIVLIAIFSAHLIIDYDNWRQGERKRMDWIREHHLGPQFNAAWERKAAFRAQRWPEKYLGKLADYIEPTYLLFSIVVVGAIVIGYHIYKLYYAQGQSSLCWT